MRFGLAFLLVSLFAAAMPSMVWAEDPPEVLVIFLGDRFEPADVAVPANVKFILRVVNKATATMEWESIILHREKVVPAGTETKIYIGPVRPGSYELFDDFHPKIRGQLVAR